MIICLSFCLLVIVSSVLLRFTDYDTSLVSLNSSWPTLFLCPYTNLCSRVFETDMELIASRHGRDDLLVISLTIIYKCTASYWISYHCDDVIRLKLRTCKHQKIPRFGKLSYICLQRTKYYWQWCLDTIFCSTDSDDNEIPNVYSPNEIIDCSRLKYTTWPWSMILLNIRRRFYFELSIIAGDFIIILITDSQRLYKRK